MKLKNKVTVITGGNSGIAMAFQSEGAVGAIVGRKQETLDRSIAELGDNFTGINADVTKMEDLERIFRDKAHLINYQQPLTIHTVQTYG